MIESSHWYDPVTREPKHFVPRADGKGTRPSTIADARKHGWYPSPTTILKTLVKPQLQDWIIQQHVLAALTTPRWEGESLDAFAERICQQDAQAEGQKARDRGTEIHEALHNWFQEKSAEYQEWIEPACKAVCELGSIVSLHDCQMETVVVGEGYAGRADLIAECKDYDWIIDWKTTKKLPKASYLESRLQLAAYAQAWGWGFETNKPIKTANCYISTVECGKFALLENPPWQSDYAAFELLLKFWQYANDYYPQPISVTV